MFAWNLPVFAALFGHIQDASEATAMLTTILIIVLILALIGALPHWATAAVGVTGPAAGLG